ncbi:unnamed protein product, partial [Ixodes persulcatus]
EDNEKGGSYWWFVIGAIPVSTFLLVTIPIAVFLRSFVGFDRVRLCETRACREAGKFYESLIDKGRVDPCDDFYSHVCEKWNRNARIPPFSRKYSFDDWIVSDIEKTIYTEVEASITEQGQIMNQMTHIPVRKFEAIFAACQNAERNGSTEDIRKVPTILGLEHFPSLDPEGDPKISVISGRLAKDFGLFPLVTVGLRVDPEDYSKVIIYLEEPETTALPKFILSTTESSNWLRQSVCDAMLTVYGIVPTNDQWDTLCDNIQAFDTDLIKRLRYAEGHRPGDYFEKKVLKLKELDNSFYWNWMTYLKTIFEGTSMTIGPQTKVLVGNVKYVAGLARFLQKQSKDVIYNYLGYRVLLRLGLLYRTNENHVKTLFYRYHLGYKTEPERWRLCLRYAERSMPMAASWIYHMWIKKKFGLKGDKLWIKFFNVYRKLYESIDYSYAYSYLTTADARVEAYRKKTPAECSVQRSTIIDCRMNRPNLASASFGLCDVLFLVLPLTITNFYRKMIYEKAYPFPDYRLSGLHHVSSDQLFFYSLAESFCEKTSREAAEELIQNGTFSPMKYRINNSLRNSAYFAKAFFCPVTSRMNAGKRSCDFWSTFKKDF